MPDSKSPDDIIRENWGKASRLTLSTAVALFLLTRGAKTGANKILEALGLDWSSLNAYAVGLFGVPVVAGLLVWSLWWARAYAERHAHESWVARVATKTDPALAEGKSRTLATWSLVLFVALPLAGLVALEAKFLHGSVDFSTSGGYACPAGCEAETGAFAHFWPAHGLPNILDTPYRYTGNLTYVPVWQPLIWLAIGGGTFVYAAGYLHMLVRPRRTTGTSLRISDAGAPPEVSGSINGSSGIGATAAPTTS